MSANSNLVIDCQVFQTASWHRGMGKYSMALLDKLAEISLTNLHDTYLVFSDAYDIPIEISEHLALVLPDAQIVKLNLEKPREPRSDYSVGPLIKQNKATLNNYIEKNFKDSQVDFFILALYLDEVCPAFPDSHNVQKCLIYYDSIPLLYHQRYSQFKGFFENFYSPHTATVFEADKLFTISKTVANDLHLILGIQKKRIVNIDGACIPRTTNIKPKAVNSLKDKKFVLMPSGQELRKNNHRAVEAFERFRRDADHDVSLVVTSTFTDEARAELGALSDYVVFTGNITEEELSWVYDKALFVLFPSEYEGLGLPILEAVEKRKIIACSEISVFKEMSENGFCYFNPLDIDSIANGMSVALELAQENKIDKQAYDDVEERYTWDRSARIVLETFANRERDFINIEKPKIAIFCPDPSGFSAIGKVVAESHQDYADYFDIDYYFDRGPNHSCMRPDILSSLAKCYEAEEFQQQDYEKYDAVVYHVGNSEYHLNTIRAALAFPGYAIFHDTNLTGLFSNLLENGYITKQRLKAEEHLNKQTGSGELKKHSNMLVSVANAQKGILVHSDYAQNAISNRVFNKVKIAKANLPVATALYPEIAKTNNEKLTISLAGIIAKVKGTDVIEQIANNRLFSDCKINIFGFSAVEPDQLAKLQRLNHVEITTNPTDFEFQRLMASTDILINVRLEYKGETSLTTLEQMRYGGVVIVRDFGWYSELPNNAVVKVKEVADVISALSPLVDDQVRLKTISNNSLKYIAENHSHSKYAADMHTLIKTSL